MNFENKNVLLSLGTDLQVCTSKNPTCCTKNMEERYQVSAKQDIQEVLQESSSALKFLISHNAAAFQGVPQDPNQDESSNMLPRSLYRQDLTDVCNRQ
ncbi:PREDICTED: glypican-5-like [Crocodylus porosus]|uniref:glypican-5-like n=1 Tax=Crocodylus porosus TaxID=8502 RepID=UPI0009400315|nr:PREDICTED: glypican-5-like [Crocodylus porosus]